jgi:hypothetical protein
LEAMAVRRWMVSTFEGAAALEVAEREDSGACAVPAEGDSGSEEEAGSAPKRDEMGRRGEGDGNGSAERLGGFPAGGGGGASRAGEARVVSKRDAAAAEEMY